jgi:hypothetical protein
VRLRKKTLLGAITGLALAAILTSNAFAASAVASGGSVHSSIDFQVSVPRVMQMKLVAHPTSLDITADDIARGSIKVSGPRVELLVNDRMGFAIRADLNGSTFNAVRISGLASPVVATQAGATVHMSSMVGRPKPAPVPVEYELQLAPGAQPGHYAWPVTLSLQQL